MKSILINEDAYINKLDLITVKFNETRKFWDDNMESCMLLLSDFDKYIEGTILINSYRHKLISYLHGGFAKAHRQFLGDKDKLIKDINIKLKTSYDLKLSNERERKAIIDGDTAVLTELESEFDNQESYIESLIKHIDKLGYALKMNTDIQMLKMGASLK